MKLTYTPEYMENKDYHQFDEFGTMILTDIVPPHVIVEYNKIAAFDFQYLENDYTVYPQDFYNMRKRINFADEKIEEEMKEIYTKEQILFWKKSVKK